MKTVTLEMPDSFNLNEKETKSFFAAMLYKNGLLTMGQAAELAEVTKRAFIETLGNYNVSLFDFSAVELENELVNAQSYHL
jgi:predicted HTH domain antitoxin